MGSTIGKIRVFTLFDRTILSSSSLLKRDIRHVPLADALLELDGLTIQRVWYPECQI